MFNLIKLVFIVLGRFSKFWATKLVSLNNYLCMIRPFLIDLNPAELKYYPFIINLDKCRGICNFFHGLSTNICVPSKTKDVNVKVINIITNKNEAKTILKHISCDWRRWWC